MLRPGGTVVRFWSHNEVDEPIGPRCGRSSSGFCPRSTTRPVGRGTGRRSDDPRVEHRFYPWQRSYSADEWVALIATYSVNQTLEPSRLAELQRGLHDAITAHGGTVVVHGSTDVSWSRAAPR